MLYGKCKQTHTDRLVHSSYNFNIVIHQLGEFPCCGPRLDWIHNLLVLLNCLTFKHKYISLLLLLLSWNWDSVNYIIIQWTKALLLLLSTPIHRRRLRMSVCLPVPVSVPVCPQIDSNSVCFNPMCQSRTVVDDHLLLLQSEFNYLC